VLKYLYLRNSNIGEEGSKAIANLIQRHQTLIELEIFNCGISEQGGTAIGNALKTNFCIEKLSIGDNILKKKDVEQIQQSVIFNTQYNQMKDSNKKFEGFAHNLIAESLKRWANHTQFVADKLKERLKWPLDDLDKKIAEVMFDRKGNMDLKAVP
jgi:Ran GTPase-activating protein (RanGAP) involved in mRNA processing and transport